MIRTGDIVLDNPSKMQKRVLEINFNDKNGLLLLQSLDHARTEQVHASYVYLPNGWVDYEHRKARM